MCQWLLGVYLQIFRACFPAVNEENEGVYYSHIAIFFFLFYILYTTVAKLRVCKIFFNVLKTAYQGSIFYQI